eukprot:954107-Prymnesium_polylepis.2
MLGHRHRKVGPGIGGSLAAPGRRGVARKVVRRREIITAQKAGRLRSVAPLRVSDVSVNIISPTRPTMSGAAGRR